MKAINKLFLIGVAFFLTSQFTYSQISFSHSIGGAYYGSPQASATAIMYSPRVNFLELSDELTVSAGTHLGLGIVYNSQTGENSFAFDFPFVAEINLGHGANADTRSTFGGFLGLGYGYSRIGSDGAFGANYNDALGPVFNGGIRALINERPVGLRISHLANTKKGFDNVLSVGLFYTFGDF